MVHLATLLMPDGPEDVTTERIVHVFAEQQWKPETLKAYRNTIASFFRWLRKSGRRNDDPSLDVPRVKKPRAHPRPCPDKYIRAAMEMATPSERLMIRLGAECGLRRGEIAAVHSDDVVADSIGHSLPAGWAAHTLRHRFATVAYSTTHDLFVVAELLGHESVETTEHYVAMPDGRLREATAAVRLT